VEKRSIIKGLAGTKISLALLRSNYEFQQNR